MAVQFSCRFAEHESFGVISGSSWILPYLCQSVQLSTAPSAAVPFSRLTECFEWWWRCVQNQSFTSSVSQSVTLCKELWRSEERAAEGVSLRVELDCC